MKKILGIIFSLIFLGLIIYNLDFKDFIQAIINFKLQYMLIFIPTYIMNLYFKGTRWKLLLSKENFKISDSFFIYSVGNALNICMPCRFGDFWRAFRIGKVLNVPKSEVLGTLILERTLDFASIIPILLIIILRYLKNDFTLNLMKSSFIFLVAAILCIVVFLIFVKKIINQNTQQGKFATLIANVAQGFKNFKDLKTFLLCCLISITVRIIECSLIYILLLGAGLKIAVSATLFVVVFNALSGMIPSVSNYIGAYQYSYVLALGIYNVAKSVSLAIVTIYEFITLLVLGIIALIYFVFKIGFLNKFYRT